ncbi:MAG: hypothetical protein RIQ88_719 [Actinomycetota bacterium]|jgi:membrane associated rhomboid family serine protease
MNTCYRHPDRETGVSCQRCDRYICPDCQTPGAVGFLCPEDSKANSNIKQATFQQGIFQRAPITIILIAINLVVFAAQLFIPGVTDSLFYANIGDLYEEGSLTRAFSSGFAHSTDQITHILFNMYSLFILGTVLEPLFGKLKFSIMYVFGIFGGTLGVLLLAPFGTGVVGASGAIFALMGAYLVTMLALKQDAQQIFIIIAINLGLSFLPGIAWEAHIGGLVVGVIIAGTYVMFRRATQRTVLYLTLVGLAVILGGVWVYGNGALPPITL